MASNIKNNKWMPFLVPLLAVVFSLVIAAIIIILIGENPITAYIEMFKGAVGSQLSWADNITEMTSLLLTGLAVGFGFGGMYQAESGGNYIDFLAPGIISMAVLFTAIFTGIEIIWDRQFGFLKETLVAPVSRTKLLLGRSLGGATIASFQGILVLIISCLIGFKITNWVLFPLALVFMFMIALLFNLVGVAIASKLEDTQSFPLIINFLIMPLFFLSGALFPLDNIPKFLETIVKINPFSYGVDGLRGTLTQTTNFTLGLDLIILTITTLVVLFIGKSLFKKIEV